MGAIRHRETQVARRAMNTIFGAVGVQRIVDHGKTSFGETASTMRDISWICGPPSVTSP
jgi:hypothetical protein